MQINIIYFFIAFFLFPLSLVSQEKGKASYYHNTFDGRKTASGTVYKKDSLYCAHRELPFGTSLKVTNAKNQKEVIVKVIDRGPFVKGRIIDLSSQAAKKLGFIKQGVANVTIEVVNNSSNKK